MIWGDLNQLRHKTLIYDVNVVLTFAHANIIEEESFIIDVNSIFLFFPT